ncbi:hypothetical protein ACHAP5_006707 [Fusarium lateritium]
MTRHNNHEERLPEGMKKVGYDADEQVYTFKDVNGTLWKSKPGSKHGKLTRAKECSTAELDFRLRNPQFYPPSEQGSMTGSMMESEREAVAATTAVPKDAKEISCFGILFFVFRRAKSKPRASS